MSLLEFTERGIYCQKAGVFIDPSKGVPRAIITHAHSDHARPGCQQYLCTTLTAPILSYRLGRRANIQSMQYGESQNIQGVKFSFHPAGHIVGSAQIRVEYRGEIWVVSGDYKIQADNISDKFQPVKCHTFITESTFGLPIYQWPDPQSVFSEINTWWASNSSQGVTSILSAYALGKAQRVIQNVDHSIGPVFCHSATEDTNNIVRQAGVNLKSTRRLPERLTSDELSNALIIAPGGGNALWLKGIQDYSTAAASGWMILRGRKNWSPVDRRFVLSDHADWQGLITTIKETGCEQVIVTHGYTAVFSRWLRESGLRAAAENANYEGEDAE